MKVPRVTLLRYRLEPVEGVSFADASPIEVSVPGFECRLKDEVLECRPNEDFASEVAAREAVECFLHSWEIEDALRRGRREITFVFEGAEVLERDPAAPGAGRIVRLPPATFALTPGELSVHMGRREYPLPSSTFFLSPDVETLWRRYEGFLVGTEPLPSMAYFCLTVIEGLGGGRTAAATLLKVDQTVLNKLGELSTRRGDSAIARKANPEAPLTEAECRWIKATLRVLIRRVGEYQAGADLSDIGMQDLPALP